MDISTTLGNLWKMGPWGNTAKGGDSSASRVPSSLTGGVRYLISSFGGHRWGSDKIYSFSDELYERFNDPEENKCLEDFLREKHELTKFENGIERKIVFSILENLSDDDTKNAALEEIEEFMKFVHLYGKVGHGGQKRINGKDYDEHPINVMINLAKYKVSYKGLAAMRLHDIVEERVKREIKKDDSFAKLKTKAIYYSIGLELYNFVRSNPKIQNKKIFYRDINIILKIIANMTNMGDKSYADYLRHQIFYAEVLNIRSDNVLMGSPEDALPLFGKFYGVDENRKLIKDYIRDVHEIILPNKEGLMSELSKIKRRTIMGKLSDSSENTSDMKPDYEDKVNGLPIQFRMWRYVKNTLIVHETGLKQHRLHKTGYFNKIMDQGAELRAKSLLEIEKDIRYLENSGLLSEDYIGFVNHFLDVYKEIKSSISGLTGPNKKEGIDAAFEAYKEWKTTQKEIDKVHYRCGNPFDGTFIKYIIMMVEGKEEPLNKLSHQEIYKDLLLLRQNILMMDENYERNGSLPTIKRFSLNSIVKNYEKLKASLSPN